MPSGHSIAWRHTAKSRNLAMKMCLGPVPSQVIMLRLPKFQILSREREFYPPPFVQAQNLTSRPGLTEAELWNASSARQAASTYFWMSNCSTGKVMTTANEIACSAVPIHWQARHHRQTDDWVSYLISPVIFLFLLPLWANENTWRCSHPFKKGNLFSLFQHINANLFFFGTFVCF